LRGRCAVTTERVSRHENKRTPYEGVWRETPILVMKCRLQQTRGRCEVEPQRHRDSHRVYTER
jgi:hypothetical protein